MADLLTVLSQSGTRKSRRAWLLLAIFAVVVVSGLLIARGPGAVRALLDARGLEEVEKWSVEIRAAAQEAGVDPELVAGIVYAESRGRVDAVSSADALGLMQLASSSASDAARKLKLPPPTRELLLSDGGLNLRLGANHLAWLIQHEGPDLERVLAAYNAGRTRVRRWIREAGSWEAWRDRRDREGDSQVLAYARAVLAAKAEFERRGRIAARS